MYYASIVNKATNHIGVQYYFVWKAVEDESVDFVEIHTKENIAYVFH